MRNRFLNPSTAGPRLAPTIERQANQFTRTKVIVRPSTDGSPNRLAINQLLFCKKPNGICDKDLLSTYSLSQMNNLLKHAYKTANALLFSDQATSAGQAALDSLNHSIFEDLEDELSKKRRLHKEEQMNGGQSDPIKSQLLKSDTRIWKTDTDLQKYYEDNKISSGLWVSTITPVHLRRCITSTVAPIHHISKHFSNMLFLFLYMV